MYQYSIVKIQNFILTSVQYLKPENVHVICNITPRYFMDYDNMFICECNATFITEWICTNRSIYRVAQKECNNFDC